MKGAILLFCFAIYAFTISCGNKDSTSCQYKLEQLTSDTVVAVLINHYDTLTEVRDKVKDSTFSTGVYSFDEKRNLRFYGFFINENEYRYSEEFDLKGNLIRKEGTPLLEYRLWKKNDDTVLFNCFLFSLNKKYEDIEIVTSYGDTIRPTHLYKSDFYTNVKCFPFKLAGLKKINNLIFYAQGVIVNTCTQGREYFSDTTSFKQIEL